MTRSSPVVVTLEDYEPTAYRVDNVRLCFHLHPTATEVVSEITFERRAGIAASAPLILNGEQMILRALVINGVDVDYRKTETELFIEAVPDGPFTLTVTTLCNPQDNTALSGLYMSNGLYCTQCEAEGFRRISYFYDRPDVMARYHVRIEAPLTLPVLLSNGNRVTSGLLDNGTKHFAEWSDPHPKPSYLFALVAGDLDHVEDHFVTAEKRNVKLGIYVEKGKADLCSWAMTSLKASMAWDERRFGRCYDLDVFNIVAVSDFTMGAMENKGLNIFNDKYILARPETATDVDYELIEAIIAHEYFHNWTGNRITCRDWFQLCLKEGLTVFRDQEFTADLRSRAVKRIDDVQDLRSRQFPEDQGPLSHPPRPSSYIEINNFYTATVYEKGAEICRMILTLVGAENFRRGMDLYFLRHDGDAATVEQFVQCFAEISGRDFSQFFLWYTQAGTPHVTAHGHYDNALQTFTLSLTQKTVQRAGEGEKKPFHIPLGIGLIDYRGKEFAIESSLVELTGGEQAFTFPNITSRPLLSLNRNFTAPIVLSTNATQADLLFLMGHDNDAFNRWEAAQTVALDLLVENYDSLKNGGRLPSASDYAAALHASLEDTMIDDSFKAKVLSLPSVEEMLQKLGDDIDPDLVFAARKKLALEVAKMLLPQLKDIYHKTRDEGVFATDAKSMARRSLNTAVLHLAGAADSVWVAEEAFAQFQNARFMTVEQSALSVLSKLDHALRQTAIAEFERRHSANPLIMDKWFAVQALIEDDHAPSRVKSLISHAGFSWTTPNRVYALLRNFAGGNLVGFHKVDGEGYRLIADAIITLNGINPQVASRLATSFRSWRLFDSVRCRQAQHEMQRILSVNDLSRDVFEIISRTLAV